MSYLRGAETTPGHAAAALAAAHARYQSFHGFASARVKRGVLPRPPAVVAELGELRGIIYRSDRGQRGSPRDFVHFFDTPPRLLCDPDGRQLYLHGGAYRVTRLGVEG